MYEQYHLRSSINFAKHIKPGTITAGMVKNDLKGTTKRCVASGNAFSVMSSVKGTPAYCYGCAIRDTHVFFDIVIC